MTCHLKLVAMPVQPILCLIEPANSTVDCPHRYGYYKVGDERQCGQFLNCVEGIAYKFDCPQGLAFNPDTYQCDWPDLVAACNAEGMNTFERKKACSINLL